VTLLSLPLLAASAPEITFWSIHPGSILLLLSYGFGLRLLAAIKDDPMWSPVVTEETRREVAEPVTGSGEPSTRQLWRRFGLYAAAVRRGAVHLAVGDIIGGNSFEVLFLAAADVCYRRGSIYHAFTPDNVFTALVAMLMTGVLLLGMLRRERRGIAGIGFESALVLLLYAASAVMLLV
jgi:cation:H+ antiporter